MVAGAQNTQGDPTEVRGRERSRKGREDITNIEGLVELPRLKALKGFSRGFPMKRGVVRDPGSYSSSIHILFTL